MASKLPVWRGAKDVQEDPASPIYSADSKGPKYTRIFRGPYDSLMGNKPSRLDATKDIPVGFLVDTVDVRKAPGGLGVMTLTFTPAPIQDYTFAENLVLELEWLQVEKKLETHPIFRPAGENPGVTNCGEYVLAETRGGDGMNDYDKIEAWKSASTGEARKTAYEALSSNAQTFVDKLAKGEDSYLAYIPVCRRTTKSATPPTHGECGLIEDPPGEIKVADYTYVKTADRGTRDRTWTRCEEWTGFRSVDSEIYGYG